MVKIKIEHENKKVSGKPFVLEQLNTIHGVMRCCGFLVLSNQGGASFSLQFCYAIVMHAMFVLSSAYCIYVILGYKAGSIATDCRRAVALSNALTEIVFASVLLIRNDRYKRLIRRLADIQKVSLSGRLRRLRRSSLSRRYTYISTVLALVRSATGILMYLDLRLAAKGIFYPITVHIVITCQLIFSYHLGLIMHTLSAYFEYLNEDFLANMRLSAESSPYRYLSLLRTEYRSLTLYRLPSRRSQRTVDLKRELLRVMMDVHSELSHIAKQFLHLFRLQITLTLIFYFLSLTCYFYTALYLLMLKEFTSNDALPLVHTISNWMFLVGNMSLLFQSMTHLTKQINEITVVTHKIINEGSVPELNAELTLFCYRQMHNKFSIFIYGFFKLDGSLMFTLICVSASFVVTLVQLHITFMFKAAKSANSSLKI